MQSIMAVFCLSVRLQLSHERKITKKTKKNYCVTIRMGPKICNWNQKKNIAGLRFCLHNILLHKKKKKENVYTEPKWSLMMIRGVCIKNRSWDKKAGRSGRMVWKSVRRRDENYQKSSVIIILCIIFLVV